MMKWLCLVFSVVLFFAGRPVVWSQENDGAKKGQGGLSRENGAYFPHPRRRGKPKVRRVDGRGMMKGTDVFESLKKEDPERFQKLMRLRETDPDAFRAQLKEFLAARSPSGIGGSRWSGVVTSEEECRELARLYHETDDEDEKKAISGKLLEKIQETFELRQEGARERLARMEEEIAEIRSVLERREQNREEICRARLEELTRDPALEWNTHR